MKFSFLTFFLLFSFSSFSQYASKDGNRIGLTLGVTQSTFISTNFDSKRGIGYNGGFSVRGNYYNDFSMIYGMQFFINKFNLETRTPSSALRDSEFSLSGVQVRLLLSYNIVKDHVSLDFGPVLQINGKLDVIDTDKLNTIKNTSLLVTDIAEINKINGNLYAGFSAGTRIFRFIVHYQYSLNNIMSSLNDDIDLKYSNLNRNFDGKLGTLSGQILFNF